MAPREVMHSYVAQIETEARKLLWHIRMHSSSKNSFFTAVYITIFHLYF